MLPRVLVLPGAILQHRKLCACARSPRFTP